MKIKELIAKLNAFDQDLEVVVDGYEGGCDEPLNIQEISIIKNYNSRYYYGSHEEMSVSDNRTTKAIIIRRK